jgi:hypothetical protein
MCGGDRVARCSGNWGGGRKYGGCENGWMGNGHGVRIERDGHLMGGEWREGHTGGGDPVQWAKRYSEARLGTKIAVATVRFGTVPTRQQQYLLRASKKV